MNAAPKDHAGSQSPARLAMTSWLACVTLLAYLVAAAPLAALGAELPSPWQWLHPSPHGFSLHAVWGETPDSVYAVGEAGVAMHFDGVSWKRVDAPWNTTLGTACGSDGILFAGTTLNALARLDAAGWSLSPLPVTMEILGVWAFSPAAVLVVGRFAGGGGAVLRFDGSTWQQLDTSALEPIAGYGIQAIWGPSEKDFFVSASHPTDLLDPDFAIWHFDGTTWQEQYRYNNGRGVEKIWGSGPQDVYGIRDSQALLHYDGKAWSETGLELPEVKWLKDVRGASDADVYVVGNEGIWHYEGRSWSLLRAADAPLAAVMPFPGQRASFVGDYGVTLRRDGAAWTRDDLPTGRIDIEAVWAVGEELYAAGGAWNCYECGAMLHFDGTAWRDVTLPKVDHLRGLWGSAADDVFSVGDSGAILHFDGTEWRPLLSNTDIDLQAVWGSSASDVYVAGWGTLLHFNGAVFEKAADFITEDDILNDVWGSSKDDVYAIGGSQADNAGEVLHFDGKAWSRLPELRPSYRRFDAIVGTRADDIHLISYGVAYHFDGESWTATPLSPEQNLRDLHASDHGVFALGYEQVFEFLGGLWLPVAEDTGDVGVISSSPRYGLILAGNGGAIHAAPFDVLGQ
ncbi:MAG: hypothetical protein HYV63_24355 [Candidatus Schekmanbacteria bacterium]|nr:hypothetical protein [Candidatus Schekmanbacteria bacterium]